MGQCIGVPEPGYPVRMYATHFGLKREPFSIAPDPRYLFMSERHREALAHLLYGVGGGGGFVLLTGEIGAGKTTVCRCFLEQIPRRCNVAYIFNPKLTVPELLRSVCEEFGIPGLTTDGGKETTKGHIDALNEFLLRTHAVGQNNVLIIDEAQNLAPEVLEQLRLLTNLETSERKLLQIILIGQPELRDILKKPELEQLAQRVIARFHLDALSAKETAQYIKHRLGISGRLDSNLFDPAAAARVHQLTGGVPRRINLLCDRAMLGAYAQGQHTISKAVVDQAATEVFGLEKLPKPLRQSASAALTAPWPVWVWALIGMGVLTVSAGVLTAGQRSDWGRLLPASPRTEAATPPAAVLPPPSSPRPAQAPTQASPVMVSTQLQLAALPADTPREEAPAWQLLSQRWGIRLEGPDPCVTAARQGLQCFKSSNGLALIRQLGRPVMLVMSDEQGRAVYGVLTHLGPDWATVVLGTQAQTVSLSALSVGWRGDFMTLWRAPEGYQQRLTLGAKGPAVDWLATQLARLRQEPAPPAGQRLDDALQARLSAFQVSQGIKPDGMAGAMTFMQINRLTGVDEPHLTTESPGRVLHP